MADEGPVPKVWQEGAVTDERPVPTVPEEAATADAGPVPTVQEEAPAADAGPAPTVQEEAATADEGPAPTVPEEIPKEVLEAAAAHDGPIPKVWLDAFSGIDVAPAITIAGAGGQCVGQINGIYELCYSSSDDGTPSFQHRDYRDVWLYLGGDMRWWISNTKSKDARASSGWAYSKPVVLGTPPGKAGIWGLIQQNGQWQDLALEATLSSLEDAMASATEAWRQALLAAGAAPATIISGAKGARASLVNGTYVLAEPASDGEPPSFRNCEFDDTWLYFARDGRWWISSTERKNERGASGWAYSQPVAAGTLPVNCAGWRVTLGDGQFADQALKVASCTQEEAETVKAAAWSRAIQALRAKQVLVVTGASGPKESYINGVYELQLDPKGVAAPSFLNRDIDHVALYHCSDGRWWVTRSVSDIYEVREPGGWACSRQVGRGTLPHKASGWKVSQHGGTWRPQNLEVVMRTKEEVDESIALAWRNSFAGALEKPLIDISGATGDNASLINGTYKLSITGDVSKPPLYRKRGEVDTWLYFTDKGRTWWVSSTKFKDARQPAGWAHGGILEPGALPTAIKSWSVFAGNDSWESQNLQVVSRSSSELVAHAAGAWRKAYSDMLNLPVVEITGASGELGSINGAYELRPSYIDKGTLIFQNRVHEGIWLYPGKDSRWWVSDSKRKDARDAGGWACSEPVDLGTPPTAAGGWSVCHGGHRWEVQPLQIKAKALEDIDPSQVAAWKGAVETLQSTPVLRISGATGEMAAATNGVYVLQPSIAVGAPPVFRERDDNERWLYFVPRKSSWWIGNTKRKDDCEAKGWARSGRVEPGTLPSAAGDWKASDNGGSWHAQPQLCVEAEGTGGGPPAAKKGALAVAAAGAPFEEEAEFILDNSLLKATTLGVRHCLSRSLDDVHETLVTPWGCSVKGIDSADGWVMCADGSFLPFALNGVRVLYRKVEQDHLLDNGVRKFASSGMRHRLSRSLDDLHPTAHSCWNSLVRGIDLGDGWLRVSGSGTYLPVSLHGNRVLIPETELMREYVLDNSKLKAATKGMRHRLSRDLDDFHPTAHTRWGRVVMGIDLKDGWLRLAADKLYMPMVVDGTQVLVHREDWEAKNLPMCEYVADNSELKASTKGMRHRQSKSMEDYHESASTKWGRAVEGIDLGDGWLKTADGLFLPLVVDGVRVLLTNEEAAALEAARQDEAVPTEAAEMAVTEEATVAAEVAQLAEEATVAAEVAQLAEEATVAAEAAQLGTVAAAIECEAVPTEAARQDGKAIEEEVAVTEEATVVAEAPQLAEEATVVAEAPQLGIAAAKEGEAAQLENVVVAAQEVPAATEAAVIEAAQPDMVDTPQEAVAATAEFVPPPTVAPRQARPDIEPVEGYIYLADNSLLGAATHGIQHRYTRCLQDVHPTEGTPWGSIVQGVDLGDGWVRVHATGRYVPMTLQGVGVLVRLVESDYRADNSLLQARTAGVQHRQTKNLKDVLKDGEGARTKWGEVVRGVDLGDGWLRLSNGHFVPTALDGVPVLIRKLAVEDMFVEALPAMPAIPEPDIVPAPRFGFAR